MQNQTSKLLPLGFTVQQTASIFSKNPLFVYRRVREGKLTLVKLTTRSSLVTRESIIAYAESIGLNPSI